MFGMGSTTKKSDYKEDLDRVNIHVKTTLGEFEAELFAKECPETVWNFVNLAEGRQEGTRAGAFYDGLVFHRVISGFMIQGGCPEGTGRGGPGYRFQDECHPELIHSGEGIFSMANSGPGGTNGSQFFITLAPTPHLNGRHTVFGRVTSGIEVIRSIGKTPTDHSDRPVTEVVIEEIKVIR
jgi:peptidyl-prolyl cis-trans isomerase A (cyclophilin A)